MGPHTLRITLATLAIGAASFAQSNDLAALNDDFGSNASSNAWLHRHAEENLGFDPLAEWSIDSAAHPGVMRMIPETVGWYEGYKGPLVYKEVSGDFVFTTRVAIDNRAGTGLPTSLYSLAGVMIREPAAALATPENYVFLSLGFADPVQWSFAGPGPHFEVKTTVDGTSTLEVTAANTFEVELQVARIGTTVIALYRRPNEGWTVHRRYARPDFGVTMQVGLVTYTDWPKLSTYTPAFHNTHLLVPPIPGDPSSQPGLPFHPDLVAEFDFAHFARPLVPNGVDPATASFGTLLTFLGDLANPSFASYCTAGTTSQGCLPQITASGVPSASAASGFTVTASSLDGQRTGLLFYGIAGSHASPWGAGSTSFLCVKAPTQRTMTQMSGGTSGACDGTIALDWNTFRASHPNSLGSPFTAGDALWLQAWLRDPAAVKTTGTSDALWCALAP